MESLNKRTPWEKELCPYRELSLIWGLKCTGKIGVGTSGFVLYREVSLFRVSFIRGSTVHVVSYIARLRVILVAHIQWCGGLTEDWEENIGTAGEVSGTVQ